MSQRRKIDWSAAMRDVRQDRAAPRSDRSLGTRSVAIARCSDAVFVARSIPLRTKAGFDRSAIMAYALVLAQSERARGSARPWRSLMSVALQTVWARAKAAPVPAGAGQSGAHRREARP